MSDGRTHRAITVTAAPIVGLLALGTTRDIALSLAAAGGVSVGLMLHPDLDLSRNPLWRPYSKLLKHRSPWSHWPILGTWGRLMYLACMFALVLIPAVILWTWLGGWIRLPYIDPRQLPGIAAMILGLMVSDALHYLADRISTGRKKWRRR